MAGMRWVPLALLLAGPGCAITVREQLPNDDQTVSTQRKERFGELITGPGQRVSMSHVPVPLEGPIPTAPPQPSSPSGPRAAENVAPPPNILPTPLRPDESRTAESEPGSIFPPIFRHGPDTPLLAAVRAYQDGRTDFGLEQLRPFPVANQDVLAKILPAAARTAVGNLNDPKEAGEILAKLEVAADQLRPRSELRIDAIHVCSAFVDFGEFTPISPSVPLRPGQYVKLYAEVKGAVPEIVTVNGETRYVFRYGTAFRIRGNGFERSQGYERKTRSAPKDIVVITEFPAPMTPGTYAAELELTDTAGRRAKRSVEFRVDERK